MDETIQNAERYIKALFENESSGHDYFHSMRVYMTAVKIAEIENADILTVSLAALLHDADDRKLFPETYESKEHAVSFLRENGVDENMIQKIKVIIGEISFAGSDSVTPSTIEGKCVQDSDRLDALGAVGIARTFQYGGSHGREMYNPDVPPKTGMSGEEYNNHISSSLNHFYEKLFLLRGMMNTETGRKIAEKREKYMRGYVDEFLAEWSGEDFDE